MSVRVVSRIRPLLDKELDKDIIVRPESAEPGKPNTIVKIPNPKNEDEEFSFTFNGVYDQMTSQETLFACGVQPHLKSLFQGYDVTIFAYGVTGTGKTYTMRGGLKLADRGVIQRLLSGIFRRGKRIVRDTCSRTTVRVTLSYYEIYNDRFFDLLEPPERRTPAGLPLRAEANGRTVIAGPSERACEDLGDFEKLYIEANNNRVTAATKLNAHSSRSHAILRIKLTQTTDDSVLESTASAIDLAGSEDNRRTDNGRERLVESAAINKSLFVLSQCIEAIARGDKRIPYRESKMTRILSLDQNRGITVMILNLAPLRSYHLDTLSSLNVSSRAKRIEVREIENEVVFKQMPQATTVTAPEAGVIARQPLRPLPNAHNTHHGNPVAAGNGSGKASDTGRPVKAFNVYADRTTRPSALPQTRPSVVGAVGHHQNARLSMHKRPPEHGAAPRLTKAARPAATISAAAIEAMVEKVCEILAAQSAARPASSPEAGISDAVQRRLEALERRIESEERRGDGKSDGLRLLLAARQYKEAGEEAAALYAYEAALPYFPSQSKLLSKIERLRARLGLLPATDDGADCGRHVEPPHKAKRRAVTGDPTRCQQQQLQADTNAVCHRADGHEPCSGDATGVIEDMPCRFKPSATKSRRPASTGALSAITTASSSATKERHEGRTGKQDCAPASQRTRQLLDVVNSRDPALIRSLVGFGAKCARDLMDYLEDDAEGAEARCIATLDQLRALPGMGNRTVERAYQGLAAAT